MKFKVGCATAVLSLLCFDAAYCGAAKDFFSKDSKIENAKEKKDASSDTEVQQSSSPSEEETTNAPTQTASADSDKNSAKPATTEKKQIVGDPVVVIIHLDKGKTKQFRRSQVLAAIKQVPPTVLRDIDPDKLFKMLTDQLVSAYLMVDKAKKLGLDRTPEFLEMFERNKEELLGRALLMRELGQIVENESALKARYTKYLVEFKKGRECKVFHILLSSEAVAQEVLASLAKGEDFSKLAQEKSEAPSKTKGGEEGYLPLDLLPPQLKDKLSVLKEGEYTKEFVKLDDKFHIIKVTDWRDTTPLKFDEAKDMLKQMVLQEEMTKLLARLKKQVRIEKFNEDGSPEGENNTPKASTPESVKPEGTKTS